MVSLEATSSHLISGVSTHCQNHTLSASSGEHSRSRTALEYRAHNCGSRQTLSKASPQYSCSQTISSRSRRPTPARLCPYLPCAARWKSSKSVWLQLRNYQELWRSRNSYRIRPVGQARRGIILGQKPQALWARRHHSNLYLHKSTNWGIRYR